jgi:hypothetical protein
VGCLDDTPLVVLGIVGIASIIFGTDAGSACCSCCHHCSGSHHHKLLLNPKTLKFSTDTQIAAVPQCLVHVEILVNLVEILVDGVKWSKIYAVPIGYRVALTRESYGEELHYTRN